MIADVAAANPNTIVVINSGGPVVMPWLSSVAGVFENWYGGQETGAAMAALIFGTADPSGKLPVTFPASLSQVPAQTTAQWPGTSTGVTYSEGVDIGYRWYQSQNITPLFPFGYGLSYTKFSFSNLNVGAFNANGKATVTATVTNTGSVAGADVAQLYVGDPAASQDPPEQLAGFQRVTLNPGQSATVTFPLTIHDLASWSPTDNAWEAQAGTYSISVGDSSANLPLTGSTSLAHELTGQVAAGASGAGVSLANTAVSANVTPNSGVPGAETVGVVNPFGYSSPKGAAVSFTMQAVDSNSAADPHLHRHRAAAGHQHRLERHDLGLRQHARDLHRDRDRDRHGRSLRHGHLRLVRRAVTPPRPSPDPRPLPEPGGAFGLKLPIAGGPQTAYSFRCIQFGAALITGDGSSR